MSNPIPRLTPEELKARQEAREALELVQMENLHEALGHLIAVKRMKLRPTNANLLWAEWHYAKAMDDLYSDNASGELFQTACDNLGVDAEGNDSPETLADYADHMNDRIREDRMIAEWEAGR